MDAYKIGIRVALDDAISASLSKMSSNLLKADEAAVALKATMAKLAEIAPSFAAMTEGTAGLAAAMRGLATSAAEAAASIKAIRLNGMGGGAGGGSGGKKPGMSVFGFTPQMIAGQAAAFGTFEALKGGMNLDDAVARALIAMNMPVNGDYMQSAVAQAIKKNVLSTSTGFGVSQGETEAAMLSGVRDLAPLTPEQRMRLMPSLLKFAGAEVLGKHGTTMDEAMQAGIGLAHQLRLYSPEAIEPVLKNFAKLSMATPQSLGQMSRAASYYLPLLTAGLGMDSGELLALGTVGSQMGLNTKAGTWLANMFSGPFTADLTSKRQGARLKALQELGLVQDGKVVTHDAFEFLEVMAARAGQMSGDQRTRAFTSAFGKEGARAAAIYTEPAVMKNIRDLRKDMVAAPDTDKLQGDYAKSPLVQFHKAQQELMDTLTRLGETTLPTVTTGLRALKDILETINRVFGWKDAQEADMKAANANSLSGSIASWKRKLGIDATPPANAGGNVIQLSHETKLDGRVLAKSTTRYQVEGVAGVSRQTGGFDGNMALRPVQ